MTDHTPPPEDSLTQRARELALEAACLAFAPKLFGNSEIEAHQAASPLRIDFAKAATRKSLGPVVDAVLAQAAALRSLQPVAEIPAGMKAWHGGDSAPADWDGGPVMFRDGETAPAEDPTDSEPWDWSHGHLAGDIIAYTPKSPPLSKEATADTLSVLRPFADAINGDEDADENARESAPIWECGVAMEITFGDLRKARDLYLRLLEGEA